MIRAPNPQFADTASSLGTSSASAIKRTARPKPPGSSSPIEDGTAEDEGEAAEEEEADFARDKTRHPPL